MKLVSLNVEGAKHLARFVPFLETERPGAICLQELFEKDGQVIAEKLGMSFAFAPMLFTPYEGAGEPEALGIGLFSRVALSNIQVQDYWSPGTELPLFDLTDTDTKRRTQRVTLLSAEVPIDGADAFTLLTTHFTWTPDGKPDAYQETDADALLALLSSFPRFALCGDFNIPRGFNPLYERFASRYADAIPRSYASSLDLSLHRAGRDPIQSKMLAKFMVDYLFLEGYRAENVRLEFGVSDHAAIIGDVYAG